MQQDEKFQTLWQGAAYQDKLLQSYRGFHLTTQSIFIGVSAILSATIIHLNDLPKIIFSYLLLVVITCIGLYLLRKMKGLIRARAEDINHFHRRIISYEKGLPKSAQVLTAFKLYQKHLKNPESTGIDFEAWWQDYNLTDDERSALVEKGKGHTRSFLDEHLFTGFLMVWVCLHLITVCEILFSRR